MEHLLKTILFLDVEIKINDSGIDTRVYESQLKLFF